jgi:hypothetical protein
MSRNEPPRGLSDDELLDSLADETSRRDPIPQRLVAAGRASYDWRRIDTELAELLQDSLDESLVGSGVRGSASRLLTFEAPGLCVELDVEPADRSNRLRIIGQLVPPQPAHVEVVSADNATQLATDDSGRFICDDLHAGRLKLRCVPTTGARPVETAWITI